MPEQPGSPGVEEYRGIAFGEDQPPADAVAVYKHEPEVGRAFGLPAFRGESIDGGGHGKAQVGAGARSWVNQIAQVKGDECRQFQLHSPRPSSPEFVSRSVVRIPAKADSRSGDGGQPRSEAT
jgi:hypothetical protein